MRKLGDVMDAMQADPETPAVLARAFAEARKPEPAGGQVERIPIGDRASWLALRLQDLTASDIAAVAGVDPQRTPLKVYAEKKGIIPPIDDSNILRRGRWLEAAVIEALRDEHPTWDIRRAGVYLRDPSIRMGATPDAVASDPERQGIGNVQCKVVSRPVFERDWDDGPPLKYQVQTLSEGLLVGSAWNEIAALVVDTYSADLYEFDVPRHEGAEARIHNTVVAFWQNFDAGREPSPVYSQDSDVVAALYPAEVPGRRIDLVGDNLLPVLLAKRARRKAYVKAAEKWLEGADTEIKHKLADAEEGVVPGWKITLKAQTRKEMVLPATTFRVLRITDKRPSSISHEGAF